jgi:hypothetical protein
MAIGMPTQKLKTIFKLGLLPKWFCFFLIEISTHHYLLLWKSTVIGISMSCAKFTSLGVIAQIVVNLDLMVQRCVLNQN